MFDPVPAMPATKPFEDMTLAELRADFNRSPHIAMPIAGAIAWTLTGVSGALLPPLPAVWAMFFYSQDSHSRCQSLSDA